MIYTWECNDCGERIDVHRTVADHKIEPLPHEHSGCNAEYKRIITPPKLVKVMQYETDPDGNRWPI